MSYTHIEVPGEGEPITLADEETGELSVPETPIIPIIYGDGIGSNRLGCRPRRPEGTRRRRRGNRPLDFVDATLRRQLRPRKIR